MSERKLPDDVDPQSGFRLPLPDRDGLDEEARAVYDRFVDPESDTYVGLRGPGGIRLHSPENSKTIQAVNRYIRYGAGIDPRDRELAILVVARELDSQFEWTAHEPEALKRGIPEATVEVVKYCKSTEGVPGPDVLIIHLGREIFSDHRLTSATYAQALERFGATGLVDFVSLMGNYAQTAALLAAFDMQIHPDWEPLLPLPNEG